jgi:hypothetical protein
MLPIVMLVLKVGSPQKVERVCDFVDLKSGDEIRVVFSHAGHGFSALYEFHFRRSNGITVECRLNESRWSGDDPAQESTRSGVIELGASDLSGLDRLFTYYRRKPEGDLEPPDSIHIQQIRNGKVLIEESLSDRSRLTNQWAKSTTLWSIARKIKSK